MITPLRIEIVRRNDRPHATRVSSPFSTLVAERRDASLREAAEILERARHDAECIEEDARVEADRIRHGARAEGRREGEAAWTEAAHALAESRCRALASLERDCVRLALEIARQVVGEAVRLDRSIVDAIARRACAPLKREATLQLTLAGSSADRVESIQSELANGGAISITLDPALGDGECIAECAGVRVDATLDRQLDAIERRLLGLPGRNVP